MSAWTVISHVEAPSSQATIVFSSIPASYTDLCIKMSARSTSEINSTIKWAEIILQPNGSGSNLSARSLLGYWSGSAETTASNTDAITGGFASGNTTTSNTFSNVEIYIPNYAGSTNKSWSIDSVTEHNGNEALRWISANLWSQTTAISSITLDMTQGDFAQYSSATLYGITKGSSGGVVVS